MAGILLEYRIQLVQDSICKASVCQTVETFSERDSVYLITHHASSLQMGTTKFHQDYACSFIISTVVNSTLYKLRNLENSTARYILYQQIEISICHYTTRHSQHKAAVEQSYSGYKH